MKTAETSDICVAFDLDDTLYKERDYVAEGLHNVAAVMAARASVDLSELMALMASAKPEVHDANWSPSNGHEALDALHRRLKSTPASHYTIDDYLEIYRNTMPALSLADDTVKTLDGLRRSGIALAIITDGRHTAQWNKIEALGLQRFIDRHNIIVSSDIGADKYTALPYQTLGRRVGARRYIYVGDNLSKDFYYPRILGWTAVMLRDTDNLNIHHQDIGAADEAHRPDIIIDNLKELIPLCQKL